MHRSIAFLYCLCYNRISGIRAMQYSDYSYLWRNSMKTLARFFSYYPMFLMAAVILTLAVLMAVNRSDALAATYLGLEIATIVICIMKLRYDQGSHDYVQTITSFRKEGNSYVFRTKESPLRVYEVGDRTVEDVTNLKAGTRLRFRANLAPINWRVTQVCAG